MATKKKKVEIEVDIPVEDEQTLNDLGAEVEEFGSDSTLDLSTKFKKVELVTSGWNNPTVNITRDSAEDSTVKIEIDKSEDFDKEDISDLIELLKHVKKTLEVIENQ